jgi:hypothetical protein
VKPETQQKVELHVNFADEELTAAGDWGRRCAQEEMED